jgi:hypothetical protein
MTRKKDICVEICEKESLRSELLAANRAIVALDGELSGVLLAHYRTKRQTSNQIEHAEAIQRAREQTK